MRDNFWKWLKRFFVVLPVISLIITCVWQIAFARNEANQSAPADFNFDTIGYVISSMYNDGSSNPLVYAPYYPEGEGSGLLVNLYYGFYDIAYDLTGLDGIDFGYSSYYIFSVVNFLTWWVFVELIFLFFRFVTFLISWVNSLFDNTFKKIKR